MNHPAKEATLDAAIAKYVVEKGGFSFYAERIDRSRSEIRPDGFAVLRHKSSGEVLATYSLDELGLPAATINASLDTPRPQPPEGDPERLTAPSDKRQVLGLSASAAMLAGCFAPLVRLPVAGSIHYLHNGRGDGVLIVAIAFVAAYFSLTAAYTKLRPTALGALTIIFTTLWGFQLRLSDIKTSAEESLAGNPFRGFSDALLASVGLDWGWILLLGGASTFLVCSDLVASDGVISLPASSLKLDPAFDLKRNIPAQIGAAAVLGLLIAGVTK